MKVYVLSIFSKGEEDNRFNHSVYNSMGAAIESGKKKINGKSDRDFLVEQFDVIE